jgi:hypothetical protein
MLLLESAGVGHDLLRGADLTFTGFGVHVAEEEVASERYFVPYLPTEQVVDGHPELLSDDIQAGELDGSAQLGAVVVQVRSRVHEREA